MTAADRYCEAIYELAEDDIDVLQVRIAERLGVSRPAVSEMTSRLVAEGLLASADGRLSLTDLGLRTAESAVRRHRLAERFLVDVLHLGWAEAHELAGSWQRHRRTHRTGTRRTARRSGDVPARQPDPGS